MSDNLRSNMFHRSLLIYLTNSYHQDQNQNNQNPLKSNKATFYSIVYQLIVSYDPKKDSSQYLR